MFTLNKPEIETQPVAAFAPTVALVFHSNGSKHAVTRHKVLNGKLRRGMVVSNQHSMALLRGLDSHSEQRTVSTFNDPNILFEDASRLVWFKKSALAPMWLAKGDAPKAYQVRWPNLVFDINKTNRTLKICAVASSTLPSPVTNVYLAPIWNLSANGAFCLGSAQLPDDINASTINECEATVFDSQFTHANTSTLLKGVDNDTAYKKFLAKKALSKQRFKASELVRMKNKKTLNEWLGA